MKRRVRIPEGLDSQGRVEPGTWVEFDDDRAERGVAGGWVGLVLTVGTFALAAWALLSWGPQ